MSSLSKRRKAYDRSLRTLLYLCAGITCALLLFPHWIYLLPGVGQHQLGSCSPARPAISTDTIGILPNYSQHPVHHPCWPWSLALPIWGWARRSTLTEYATEPEGGGGPSSLRRRR